MAYFMINGIDFSDCVCGLKITNNSTYNAQTNAAGNTVVDYINSKRSVEVGIIPLDDAAMQELLAAINKFNVSLTFRDPTDGTLEEINAIIPSSDIDYYTIQIDRVSYNAMSLTFTEL